MPQETITPTDLRASADTLDYLRTSIEETRADMPLDTTLRVQMRAYLARAALVMREAARTLDQSNR